MLLNLAIRNFAIVSFVEIDWQKGMTTITGETGAGKSIAIDALGLCLGSRALANTVRPGSTKAELTATFEITDTPKALKWLATHDLQQDGECIVRRVISAEGRSKAYINGSPVPLAQLKDLGQYLLNIHGQHDHQLLMKNQEQCRLLDDYANHQEMLSELKHYQNQWRALKSELQILQQSKQQRLAQQQLLQYQVKELDEFSLQVNEFTQLEADFKRNSNSQQLMQLSEQCVQEIANDEQFNLLSQLQKSTENLNQLAELDPSVKAIATLVNEARIQFEEASHDLIEYQQSIDLDPQTFALIEERYSTAVDLARKHKVAPENLDSFHRDICKELHAIASDDSRLEHIHDEMESCLLEYKELSCKLRVSRIKAATKLEKAITKSIRQLNMPEAIFKLAIAEKEITEPTTNGTDNIEFLVSMNPGQPVEPLAKVASGGELSRISLAIQVILAEKVVTPTLIFDEVDVGISGPTAAKVGQQLNKLGESTQVICVTHLPQVASKGHQQLFVAKLTDGKNTQTSVTELSLDARENEIARLLAGDEITKTSLANAKELLAS
ncbi:DNA repair protein RecN [Thalassotalea psychrophila]|uniref:DNA repair protein RecN n=1 Tax=Thalassotalea psychrophila TaxID=3065647 RepID=A0ABY9TXB4_9GAMM|nr:DNA repair protein RecN [Colwelliaceae bacterium SQ149]